MCLCIMFVPFHVQPLLLELLMLALPVTGSKFRRKFFSFAVVESFLQLHLALI